MNELELEHIEVNSMASFSEFWELLVKDFAERGLSWSGHCMYGLLDLFPRSIYEAIGARDASYPNLSWAELAEIFKTFRRLQMETYRRTRS